jgi:hypothetical protein
MIEFGVYFRQMQGAALVPLNSPTAGEKGTGRFITGQQQTVPFALPDFDT